MEGQQNAPQPQIEDLSVDVSKVPTHEPGLHAAQPRTAASRGDSHWSSDQQPRVSDTQNRKRNVSEARGLIAPTPSHNVVVDDVQTSTQYSRGSGDRVVPDKVRARDLKPALLFKRRPTTNAFIPESRLHAQLSSEIVQPQVPATTGTDKSVNQENVTVLEQVRSLKLYSPEKGVYVGRLQDLPPPEWAQSKWRQSVRPELIRSLRVVIASLPSSLSVAETMVEPELCMLGRRSEGELMVELRPTIVIRCGSKKCKKAVLEALASQKLPIQVWVTQVSPREDSYSKDSGGQFLGGKVNRALESPGLRPESRSQNISSGHVVGNASIPMEVYESDSGYASIDRAAVSTEKRDETDGVSLRTIRSFASVYSQATPQRDILIAAFAKDLQNDIDIARFSNKAIERMTSKLPDILRSFSLRLSVDKSSHKEARAKDFIRQQRSQVAYQVGQSSLATTESDDRLLPAMSSYEKVADWKYDVDDGTEENVAKDSIPLDYQDVRTFLRSSEAYCWLLKSARSMALLGDRGPAVEEITRLMHELLQTSTISTARNFDIKFVLDWDLVGFLEKQEYDMDIVAAMEYVMTITEAYGNAQLLTCLDYLTMVWPTTGPYLLRALQATVAEWKTAKIPLGTDHVFPDGTMLDIAILSTQNVSVNAMGNPVSLIELCEQLAWFGSTFRVSPVSSGPCVTTPKIHISTNQFEGSVVEVQIEFASIPSASVNSSGQTSGNCWHGLLRKPNIVEGFPTLAREEGEKGLETSLHALYALADTHYATVFDQTLLLKGHYTLLVPTHQTESSIMWHLLHSKEGERIPYYAFRQGCPDSLSCEKFTVQDLSRENIRHFVGWTSKVDRYLGIENAKYAQIERAGVTECIAGIAVEQKLTVSLSKIVGMSGSFVRSDRDKPEYFKHPHYWALTEFANAMTMVLYDTASKIGWLVDGASALLHICQTQLAHEPYVGNASMMKTQGRNTHSFTHPKPGKQPEAALHTLRNQFNQEFIVLREFDSYSEETVELNDDQHNSSKANNSNSQWKKNYKLTSFKELVIDTWGTLEQIYDRQQGAAYAHASKDVPNPTNLRKTSLRGWEYMDIVTRQHSIIPRKLPLGANSRSWKYLVRQPQIVTLFGQHFGELYKPAETELKHVCGAWRNVPRGHEFLVAPISLLDQMHEKSVVDGRVLAESNAIVQDAYWNPSTGAFQRCDASCRHDHGDRVQMFSKHGSKRTIVPQHFTRHGAVIFGDSSDIQRRGPSLAPDIQLEEDPNDSGIGSSLQVSSILTPSVLSQVGTEENSQSAEPASTAPLVRETQSSLRGRHAQIGSVQHYLSRVRGRANGMMRRLRRRDGTRP